MNFPLYIALRYLFSKKSHNAINVISLIAVCGIAIATMATVCTLSVLNGFKVLVSDMFSSFDPELKITPVKGKVFDPTTVLFEEVYDCPEIELVSETLEESVLLRNEERQVPAIMKGVSSNFADLIPVDEIIYAGEYILQDEINDFAIPGLGLASNLGIFVNQRYPLDIYAPKRNVPVNMTNPAASFTLDYAYVSSVFLINQAVYDENYLLVPLSLARELFDYPREVSALEIKAKAGTNLNSLQSKLKKHLGEDYEVKNRYEQQESAFRMMNIEKWVSFLILCFILLIAVFNVIGSLSMLIVDKQKDIATLSNLGANNQLISRIFLFEGWLISAIGAVAGITLGVVICLGQQYFGWLQLGTGGAFTVSAYPVHVEISDLLIIFVAVLTIGFLAVLYPVHYLSRKWLR